jgi:hypothetical protein
MLLIIISPNLKSPSENGQAAQALNKKFQDLTASSPCQGTEQACVGGQFAQCTSGKFAVSGCSGGTKCFALPLVNKAGTVSRRLYMDVTFLTIVSSFSPSHATPQPMLQRVSPPLVQLAVSLAPLETNRQSVNIKEDMLMVFVGYIRPY